MPVLITTGEHDELTPACALRMKLALPNAELKVFANASHMPFYENPGDYYPVLLDFLSRHKALYAGTCEPKSDESKGASATMHRYKFVLTRPLQFLPVLFGISVITFILVRLIPGDPARNILGTRATPTAIANIRAQYGLDQPMWLQYFYFLRNLANGEMGKSILYKIDVLKLIVTRIEPTLALVLSSVILSILIAVPLSATRCAQQRPRARSRHPHRLDLRHRLSALLAGADADHPLQRRPRSASRLRLRQYDRREGLRISFCRA